MVLVLDLLDYIGRIYSPLNLANVLIQKTIFVRIVFHHKKLTPVWYLRIIFYPKDQSTAMDSKNHQKKFPSSNPIHPEHLFQFAQIWSKKLPDDHCTVRDSVIEIEIHSSFNSHVSQSTTHVPFSHCSQLCNQHAHCMAVFVECT